jgi:sugar (pentulose or hexulose) kinase
MALRVDHSAILSIDIGTTFLKCNLYDLNLDIISTDALKVSEKY